MFLNIMQVSNDWQEYCLLPEIFEVLLQSQSKTILVHFSRKSHLWQIEIY